MIKSKALQKILNRGRKGNVLSRLDDLEQKSNAAFLRNPSAEQLTDITLSLGTTVDGAFVAPASSATSVEPTDSGFTGVAMGGDGWTFLSQVWHFVAVAGGALQAGFNYLGKFIAGGGAVTLDEDGLTFDISGTYSSGSSVKFASGGNIHTDIYGAQDASNNYLSILTNNVSGKNSRIDIRSDADTPKTARINIASSAGGDGCFIFMDNGDMTINSSASVLIDSPAIHITGATNIDGALIVNENSADVDTRIESNGNANAVFVDAGNDRVGIMNGAPASALDVTGLVTVSGGIDNTNGHCRSYTVTMNDDTATSFTPTKSAGMILFSTQNATNWGMIFYNTAAPSTVAINVGSNTNVTTGALAGTTGTDGKFTVSAHATDGKLYFENRSGGSRTIYVTLF